MATPEWIPEDDDIQRVLEIVRNIRKILNKPSSRENETFFQRMWRGILFNRSRWHAYKYNELYIIGPNGERRFVDSYDENFIVSRKDTQISEIDPDTVRGYIREIAQKYTVGRIIGASKPNIERGICGQSISGAYILEVPLQKLPIARSIIDYASSFGVSIRDVAGRVYK